MVSRCTRGRQSYGVTGGIHVALEFSSAQCRVVDSYLVYCARKILTVDTITGDLQMVCRHRDQPEFVHGVHLHAGHVQAQDDELSYRGEVERM